MAIKFQILCK